MCESSLGTLSKDDGDAEDNVWLKMNEYFICESCSYLDVFSASFALKTAPAEDSKAAFISKKKNKHLGVVVHVLQNTENLVISRCCLAEDGKEMHKGL